MKRSFIYLSAAIICFTLCVVIAFFLDGAYFIRGFAGDIIVTLLIFCFVKIFYDIDSIKLSIYVLIFSFEIEFFQYLELIEILGISDSKIAKIVIGTTFDFLDLIAYTIGVGIAYVLDVSVFRRIAHRQRYIENDKCKRN